MTALAALGLLWLGTMFGFFTCACLVQGSLADGREALSRASADLDFWKNAEFGRQQQLVDVIGELESRDARIGEALGQITPHANATVKRIARILKGEA